MTMNENEGGFVNREEEIEEIVDEHPRDEPEGRRWIA
jgi:hypothetical protein